MCLDVKNVNQSKSNYVRTYVRTYVSTIVAINTYFHQKRNCTVSTFDYVRMIT